MKRIGLLSIIGCSVSTIAIAAGVDCNTIPTCAEMGFTKTVTDCEGKVMLRCPFDLTNDKTIYCAEGNSTCDELFTLDACPTNGICAECNGKYILYSCNNGYIHGVNKCCNKSEYNLLQCPAEGECSSCGQLNKLEKCNSGYTLSDTNCCSDEYYNLDTKPDNATVEQCGNKYHFISCNDGYTEENGSCIEEETCKFVGDILYNDLKCYSTPPSGKTAIGVVFDATNKLAIELAYRDGYAWGGYGTYITTLTDCTSIECDTKGKENTQKIVAALGTDNAAGFCYNLTTGNLTTGSWFLPSAKELYTVFNNKSTINEAISSINGTPITDGHNWSSNENNSGLAWRVYMQDGSANYYTKSYTYYYTRCAIAY